jgi:putative ABC transport system permease protein
MNLTTLFKESFTIAWNAISANRFRAFLTMLGISIGIFAITLIGTMVYSLESAITRNLSALGNTVMYIHHWPWKDNSSDWYRFMNRPKVSYRDFEYLQANIPGTLIAYEMTRGGQKVKVGKNSLENVTLKGVTWDYQSINDFQFQQGRYFTPIESSAGRLVCLLGFNVAKELFSGSNPVGQYVLFAGQKIQVVGVVEKQGSGIFGDSFDDRMVVPYPLMARIFNEQSRAGDRLITVKANSYEEVPRLEDEVRGWIRAARGLKPSMEDNFAINKQEMLMTQLDSIFSSLRIGGVFISILSILVGGFGIANIMFVSVKERTHEIGIQKSLGATREFILLQFLQESVLLCIAGGIIGIILLFIMSGLGQFIINKIEFDFKILISWTDLIYGIILSVAIGIISGFSPSWIAAKMDPVEAMRSRV